MKPLTQDLIANWLEVRRQGYITIAAAAERLGVTPKVLEYAILKGRKDGDLRIPVNLRKAQPSYSDAEHSVITRTSVRRNPQQDAWAARVIAGRAHDALDAAGLIAALGLDATVAKRWGRRGKPTLVFRRGRR